MNIWKVVSLAKTWYIILIGLTKWNFNGTVPLKIQLDNDVSSKKLEELLNMDKKLGVYHTSDFTYRNLVKQAKKGMCGFFFLLFSN